MRLTAGCMQRVGLQETRERIAEGFIDLVNQGFRSPGVFSNYLCAISNFIFDLGFSNEMWMLGYILAMSGRYTCSYALIATLVTFFIRIDLLLHVSKSTRLVLH